MYRALPLLPFVLIASVWIVGADAQPPTVEKRLFDFEDPADVKVWSSLELPGAREPAVKRERVAEHATSGKHSLKLTFAGGRWPTVTTSAVPDDWESYQTFRADVTVSRPCLVGFAILQEKSSRAGGWDGAVSRWVKTVLARPGRNAVSAPLHPNDYSALHRKLGKVVRFEVFLYNPHEGESIYLDNVRLTTAKEPAPPARTEFKVLGTDWTVANVQELGKKLKGQWQKPKARTVADVEEHFRARFAELKKTHPRAVLAFFRDGEKGYDPARPERVYSGWKDAYWSSHGPDGMTEERARNQGTAASHEIFMRHRSPLMRVELGSIPPGATILAAELVIVRANATYEKGRNPEENANMWVVEPCNRPWVETEVNAYEYARDRFWKAIGGMYYGDDPDFLPLYLAHGPGGGKVSTWDFKEAVKFWTDGKHVNHGFMLHGDSFDWMMRAHSREAREVKDRPAVLVVYEPK
ncbi:MAG TPA: DNRLRE domain-containing protein [Gemmataceae bacterium]|nr:DNRLRE domain-containing protein [Gemmataceae bacterium]